MSYILKLSYIVIHFEIVLHETERRIKMTKTKKNTMSMENYARLANRGFTNKQIAVYWRTGSANIAAYAANAKRFGLIHVK